MFVWLYNFMIDPLPTLYPDEHKMRSTCWVCIVPNYCSFKMRHNSDSALAACRSEMKALDVRRTRGKCIVFVALWSVTREWLCQH